ncbi:MAG: DNA mismatch repair endonuclease MutL [Acidobacteriota bacterium]
MSKIQLLSDHLISQIAAGEVVERPASVVKELVENALDAGALEVRVELESGGKRRLRVIDDGSGMDSEDALLAFDRHATSKIRNFDDLERVGTLGFRGEALATIAAVARVELLTAEQPGEGFRVRIEGGRVKSVEPAARPRGTTVEVASLFFNVPARRKFLKQPATELRRCVEVVQGYALARPDVRFALVHEGRTLMEALPSQDDEEGRRERIAAIFGRELAGGLTPVRDILPPQGLITGRPEAREEGEEGSQDEDFGDGVRLAGFVGDHSTSRGRRLFTFVNRRLIRDRSLLATFYKAVREEWRTDQYPALFFFIDLPPEDVDVNVHPQKAEVRFRDPRLLDRVGDALRDALARAQGEAEAPLRLPQGPPKAPFVWQGVGQRSSGPANLPPSAPVSSPAHSSASPLPSSPLGGEGQGSGADSGGGPGGGGVAGGQRPLAAVGTHATGSPVEAGEGTPAYGTAAPFPGSDPSRPPGTPAPQAQEAARRLAAAAFPPVQRAPVALSGRSGEARTFQLLGQYKGALILLQGPDGLYLIDQHAAHERILYERLRRDLDQQTPPSQRLLTPLLLDLAPAEALRLRELAPHLEPHGFVVEPLSGNSLAVAAIPASLSQEDAEELLLALAADSEVDSATAARDLGQRLLDTLATNLSCRKAVKMHHVLTPEEMEAVVEELFQAEYPYACPHGRPIVLVMDDADLERRFGRRN